MGMLVLVCTEKISSAAARSREAKSGWQFVGAVVVMHPVRLAYQPPASSTFLSQQTSHQQPASNTFLSEQTSTSHQPTEQPNRLMTCENLWSRYHCLMRPGSK
jgi:hypothetical protein